MIARRRFPGVPIQRGDVKRGGFVAAVSGKRRGKGSSREQSPYAELCAGIQLVIAENIERIYKQNCQNLGVLTSTDFSLIDKIRSGADFAIAQLRAMKMQPALARALGHKGLLKA